MKLRVGVVGLGTAWEKRYRTALRALSDRYEVRAVCEPVAHRAAQVARDFNASAVDGFRAMSRREDVDAVLVLCRRWYGSLPVLAANHLVTLGWGTMVAVGALHALLPAAAGVRQDVPRIVPWQFGIHRCGRIIAIGVRPGHRRGGVASRLARELLEGFRKMNLPLVQCLVRKGDPLGAFFGSLGFETSPWETMEKRVG